MLANLCCNRWTLFFQFAVLTSAIVVTVLPSRLPRARFPLANTLSIASMLIMVSTLLAQSAGVAPAGGCVWFDKAFADHWRRGQWCRQHCWRLAAAISAKVRPSRSVQLSDTLCIVTQ
jgi:hypothetical protein